MLTFISRSRPMTEFSRFRQGVIIHRPLAISCGGAAMKVGWRASSVLMPFAGLVMLGSTTITVAGPMDDLAAAAKSEGQLTVIALPRDWCGYGGVIDRFKATYGLRVNE